MQQSHSKGKGTGKSTICRLARRLFGEKNCRAINGLDKLTGRFNSTVINSKLITAEEVKSNPKSNQGNNLKRFITEDTITTEAKGRDAQQVQLCSNLMLTTNHMPLWIEADDRRIFVVDCDHEGHASGPRAKEFGEFMTEFVAFMEDDRAVAKLYNALMQREQTRTFNPNSLNIAEQSNPLMRYIQDAASSVTVEQMEEFIASTGQFAIPQEEIISEAVKNLHIKPTQVRHVMVEMRWNRRNVKWGGVDHKRYIWVHPDYEVRSGYVEGPNGYREKIKSDQFDIEIIN